MGVVKKTLLTLAGMIVGTVVLLIIYIVFIQPTNSQTKGTEIGIARRVTENQIEKETVKTLKKYNPKEQSFSIDLRSKDLSQLNLRDKLTELQHASFSDQTQWPDELPNGFDPDIFMENGKNPGLNLRELHQQKITGKNISVGIIDQTLYTEHKEYKDRLKHYEEINVLSKTAEMHGAAVSSLAVGKNVGVAPEANLYFIASALSDNLATNLKTKNKQEASGTSGINYIHYAKAIDRFLELNETLPEKERIRVISISRSFNKEDKGYDVFKRSFEKAKKSGILVVTASMKDEYGVGIMGMNREPMNDPDDLASYSVGSWAKAEANKYKDCVFFPMDCRTRAGTYGETSYEYDYSAGLSWVVPYIAGLYALSCQVNPEVTPEVFLEKLIASSSSLTVDNEGKTFEMKYVVNPVALIQSLRK
ncbi:S8 family serine peptidase [Enterococcus sp. DIV0756]|uniref:S8 family serine peptidase n=1 Tax=Enterococcus sp. DIV0756 TaxID=2774636 RepID=UPI003F23B8BA